MGWIANAAGAVGKFLIGDTGGKTIQRGLDLASEYIEDPDKRNELASDLIKAHIQADMQTTIPWVDALHKMGRQIMWFALMWIYFYSWREGNPIPIEDMLLISAGPGVYTMLKGRGR